MDKKFDPLVTFRQFEHFCAWRIWNANFIKLLSPKSLSSYQLTPFDELEGPSEAGVVGLEVVRVKLEDCVGGGGVVDALDKGQVATQLVVPAAQLIHLRRLQVQEQSDEIGTSGTYD